MQHRVAQRPLASGLPGIPAIDRRSVDSWKTLRKQFQKPFTLFSHAQFEAISEIISQHAVQNDSARMRFIMNGLASSHELFS
jgi:hypothetical protein